MENLSIYDKVRSVPKEAQKKITDGDLKGKTDINPMWRIKVLTEQFGPCGIGWYYKITDKQLVVGVNNEYAAFVDIELYIKTGGEWSAPIVGVGGSKYIQTFKTAGYSKTNDECYKMALTDAISVACKALGVGADVYWEKDASKYDSSPTKQTSPNHIICEGCGGAIPPTTKSTVEQVIEYTKNQYGKALCNVCVKKIMAAAKASEAS